GYGDGLVVDDQGEGQSAVRRCGAFDSLGERCQRLLELDWLLSNTVGYSQVGKQIMDLVDEVCGCGHSWLRGGPSADFLPGPAVPGASSRYGSTSDAGRGPPIFLVVSPLPF